MNQIRNFHYFLVKILFHHNISYHILFSAQKKETPAKLIVACSLERK